MAVSAAFGVGRVHAKGLGTDAMTHDSPSTRHSGADPDQVHRGVIHGSFTVTRTIASTPRAVFSAYADLSVRRRWFRIPGKQGSERHGLDFRVGGGEIMSGTFATACSTSTTSKPAWSYISSARGFAAYRISVSRRST